MKTKACVFLCLVFAAVLVLTLCNSNANSNETVVYRTKTLGCVDGQYLVLSNSNSLESALDAILHGEVTEITTSTVSMEEAIGTKDGFIFHFVFEKTYNDPTTWDVEIRRVSSESLPISIPSLEAIPIEWFGWWGDGFETKIANEGISLP